MNRIKRLFEEKKTNILDIYFCAGYPQLEDTVPTLQALQEGGIDMVEIGIPFSDPMADGPVIQNAATQALRNGMSLKKLFSQLQDARPSGITIPLVLMGYLNVIYQFGFENFCKKCKECGIDGVIIPDLPFENYMNEYRAIAERYDVNVIMLITPETSEERIQLIDQNTNGFIYEVSTDATTGAQEEYGESTINYFQRIHDMELKNPTLIGFGVSNKKSLEAAQKYASGAIIGSKFVRLCGEYKNASQAIQQLLISLKK